MSEHRLNIEANTQFYIDEMMRASDILRVNRHRCVEPYDWYGPDPEPMKPDPDCPCAGCKVRFRTYE